ncbi:hypothetical protein [Streptomyces chattanoogensis]|uniref:hypothetical protein n=1 Tax=Streptomyces chattanoogensis TaxID=66876 RepID=UPI0036A0F8B7
MSGAWLKKKFPHAGLQLGTGQHALDESSLLLSQAAYDDQGAEYAKPTLRLGRERFTGGLATFFDTTDVF